MFSVAITKRVSRAILELSQETDKRLTFVNEVVKGINFIKINVLEKYFYSIIRTIRRSEEKNIRKVNMLIHFSTVFNLYGDRICFFVALATMIFSGHSISVTYIYLLLNLFNAVRFGAFNGFPSNFSSFTEGFVSIKRISEFLNSDDEIKTCRSLPKYINNCSSSTFAISLNGVTCKKCSDCQRNTLNDIDLQIECGKLIAVVGKVGSGKTSLLHVIVEELDLKEGTLEINGKISYACQEPWIFPSSIRQNILFINPMEEERYHKVVSLCRLDQDFVSFPNGDETIVSAIGLSGGQRARINLARALYTNADIYLFDDPLSAVDVKVGRDIFQDCFKAFLNGKTVVFTTHLVQHLPLVDRIIVLEEGEVLACGTFEDVKEQIALPERQTLVDDKDGLHVIKLKNDEYDVFDESAINNQKDFKNTTGEDVSLNTYWTFLKAVKNWWLVTLVLLLQIFIHVIYQGMEYLLAFWVNVDDAEHDGKFKDTRTKTYTYYYSGLVFSLVIVNISSLVFYHLMTSKVSKNLHKNMLDSVIYATSKFFHVNPPGYIINRFSDNMHEVDQFLPRVLYQSVEYILRSLSVHIIICITNPLAIVPSLITLTIIFVITKFFVQRCKTLHSLEKNKRSHINEHLCATLNGLVTIRTSKAQTILEKEFHNRLDERSSAWYLCAASNRYFALCIDLLTCMYIVVVLIIILINKNVTPGVVGLILSNSILCLSMIQFGLRRNVEAESYLLSLQRIVEFSRIEKETISESDLSKKKRIGSLDHGKIELKNLFLSYDIEQDFVLKNLNFTIMPAEKIGIVGRTGAGKSSIIAALMRLAYTQGEILIDDVSINSLGLHELRSKISIIPQEPILFSGSLRKNLDFFDSYSDATLWKALEDVKMKGVIESFPAGLDTMICEGGKNFSVGERQLLSLARTLIRKNKILILDEATANVDLNTDELIQQTIRKSFGECTVLTIAHRLNTIINSDRVLVIDAGSAVEYDHPFILLQNHSGYLYELVHQAGPSNAAILTKIAEESYTEK